MSRAIDTVTISSIEDRRLVLGNAQLAAPISQGDDWGGATRIRIALRMSFDDYGSSPPGTPKVMFGLMSNPTVDGNGLLNNGPLSLSCSHFVGYRVEFAFVRFTGNVGYVASGSNGSRVALQVGSTVTDASSGVMNTSSGHGFSASPNTIRRVHAVELIRGGTPTTWQAGQMGSIGNSANMVDIPLETFLSALEQPNVSTLSGAIAGSWFTTSYPVLSTLSIDEATNGPLNALCVSWDRGHNSNFKLHISDLTYQLFA